MALINESMYMWIVNILEQLYYMIISFLESLLDVGVVGSCRIEESADFSQAFTTQCCRDVTVRKNFPMQVTEEEELMLNQNYISPLYLLNGLSNMAIKQVCL